MTKVDFVSAIKLQTSDVAVFDVIGNMQSPSGRRPSDLDNQLSEWFSRLDEADRNYLSLALREAAELSIFSFMTILDGVSSIESTPEKGQLHLRFLRDNEEVVLSGDSGPLLHEQYAQLCGQQAVTIPQREANRLYEAGTVSALRESQTSTDGMDLHVVGRQELTPTAPAIALPKGEHRKLSQLS